MSNRISGWVSSRPTLAAISLVAAVSAISLALVFILRSDSVETEAEAASTPKSSENESKLEEAAGSCALSGASTGDKGMSLFLDTPGTDFDSGDVDFDKAMCVLDALGMPDFVRTQMGQTRALDGTQTAEWEDVEAQWNYHPDDGLDLNLRVVDDS